MAETCNTDLSTVWLAPEQVIIKEELDVTQMDDDPVDDDREENNLSSGSNYSDSLASTSKIKQANRRRKPGLVKPLSYKCTICPFKTTYKHRMEYHRNKHKNRLFSCNSCTYTTKYSTSLRRHEITQHFGQAQQRYDCKQCDFKTRNKSVLNLHLKTCLTQDIKPLLCECGVACKSEASLMEHKQTHGMPSQNQIEPVGTGSQNQIEQDGSSALEPTVFVKVEIEPYDEEFNAETPRYPSRSLHSCPHCPYKTVCRQKLQYHSQKHQQTKSLACDKCDFKTKYSTALYRHKKTIHSANRAKDKVYRVKVFNCDECDYKTKNRLCYKMHAAKGHSEVASEKPHVCFCGGRFKFASSLHLHQVMHELGLRDEDLVAKDPSDGTVLVDNNPLKEGSDLTLEDSNPSTEVGGTAEEDSWKKTKTTVTDAYGNSIFIKLEREEPETTPKPQQKMLYKCPLCKLKTQYKHAIMQHLQKHSGKPLKCELCEYRTKFTSSLRRHMVTHAFQESQQPEVAEKIGYNCTLCDYTSPYKQNLKLHSRKHSLDKPFKCSHADCQYATAYNHAFMKHMRSHNNTLLQCDKCTFETKQPGRMSWHLQRIHKQYNEEGLRCDFCDFTTTAKMRLTVHKQRSLKKETQFCTMCTFQTLYSCELKVHKRSHIAIDYTPKSFVAPTVTQRLDFQQIADHLKNALSEHVNQQPGQQIPDQANSALAPNLDFQQITEQIQNGLIPNSSQHSDSVGSDTLQVNDTVNKYAEESYRNPYEDDAPISWKSIPVYETGNAEKPFACPECEYMALRKATVQRHYQRLHGNKTNAYKCTRCDFGTKTKESLALHSKRSLSMDPLNCHCGFPTFYKCELQMHQKAHNLYRCTQCSYSSKQKSSLDKHFLKHIDPSSVPKIVYRCMQCDYSASTRRTLESHLKKIHDNADESQAEPDEKEFDEQK